MPDLTAPSAAPAAATPAAPAAPATPSTPSAPESSTPSTPAPVTPSTPETPAAPTSEGSAPPATGDAAPATIGREPQQSDFPRDPEAYLKALYAWERGEKVELPDVPSDPAAEDKADEGAKDPAVPPVGDDDEIKVLEDDEPAGYETPQALQEAIETTPGLKEVMDAHPQIKNKFAAMARENTRLRPIGEIFHSKEAAQFANETANKFVGLRTSIMSAATPEDMGGAFQQFTDEFKVVDSEGNPVLDAHGQPTYGEDFDMFMSTAVNGALTTRSADLKARIAAGEFGSEGSDTREEADMRLSAIEFVMEQMSDKADAAIVREDISGLPENIRKQIEAREAEVARKEEELGIKKAAGKKEEVKAARAASENKFREAYGQSMASQIDTFIKSQEAAGAYIPGWLMDVMVDNGHGQKIPIYGKNVLDAYKSRVNAIPMVKARLAELQMMPPSPENEAERIKYAQELVAEHMPQIMKAELSKFQKKAKEEQDARRTKRQEGRKDARIEPQGGNAPETDGAGMSDEEAYAKASEQVEAQYPDLSREQKLAKKLELRGKLQRQGR